jgi:hypothetical protein
MTPGTLVGVVLLFVGLLDLVLAFAVVGPRLPEKNRRPMQLALTVAAVGILVLGVLFLTGTIGPGAARHA